MRDQGGVVLWPPVALCFLMLLIGLQTAHAANLEIGELFFPYLSTGLAISFLYVLAFVFIEVSILARHRADRPLPIVWSKLLARAPFLPLPAVLLPLFLSGFTASKCAIPFLVGYGWDRFWADADQLVFRTDAWRITYAVLGTRSMRLCEWFYSVAWGGALFSTAALVALYASKRMVGLFFTAMFATWLIGGVAMAYAFSAAGPVFAGVFDPSLKLRFAELNQMLAVNLGNGPISETQAYLLNSVHSHRAAKGGGISAMPSMHLAAAAIYFLAAKGTRWLFPAVAFWFVIFVCSAYFGYHYWVDGIAGAIVAWVCWRGAYALYPQWPDEAT